MQGYFAVYDKDCRDFELHASMRSPENQMIVLLKFLLIIAPEESLSWFRTVLLGSLRLEKMAEIQVRGI